MGQRANWSEQQFSWLWLGRVRVMSERASRPLAGLSLAAVIKLASGVQENQTANWPIEHDSGDELQLELAATNLFGLERIGRGGGSSSVIVVLVLAVVAAAASLS